MDRIAELEILLSANQRQVYSERLQRTNRDSAITEFRFRVNGNEGKRGSVSRISVTPLYCHNGCFSVRVPGEKNSLSICGMVP